MTSDEATVHMHVLERDAVFTCVCQTLLVLPQQHCLANGVRHQSSQSRAGLWRSHKPDASSRSLNYVSARRRAGAVAGQTLYCL